MAVPSMNMPMTSIRIMASSIKTNLLEVTDSITLAMFWGMRAQVR